MHGHALSPAQASWTRLDSSVWFGLKVHPVQICSRDVDGSRGGGHSRGVFRFLGIWITTAQLRIITWWTLEWMTPKFRCVGTERRTGVGGKNLRLSVSCVTVTAVNQRGRSHDITAKSFQRPTVLWMTEPLLQGSQHELHRELCCRYC